MKSLHRVALVLVLLGCEAPEEDGATLNEAEARVGAQSAHDAWFNGLLDSDVESLRILLDDELTLSYPGGGLGRKDGILEQLAEGIVTYDSADIKPAELRLYDDIAIFNGLSTLWYTLRGDPGREDLRYTAVYRSTPDGWRMVVWHSTGGGR